MSDGPVKLPFLVRAKAWPWLNIGKIAGAVMAAIVVGFIIYRVFFLPGQLRQEAADARQDTKAAEGGSNMANAALEAVQGRAEYRETSREIVRTNEREILSAPGASDQIPADVHNAGISALRRLRHQAN